MPVIVYQQAWIRLRWVQIRRIRCAECPATFAHIASAEVRHDAIGPPAVPGMTELADSVDRAAGRSLAKAERDPRRGLARCPACRRLQPWMIRAWFRERPRVVFLIVGAAAAFGVLPQVAWTDGDPTIPGYLAGFAIVAALWTGVALLQIRMELGSPDLPNVRAMRDAELRAFLADCAAREADPAADWRCSRVAKRAAPRDMKVIPLPFLDLAGGLDPPRPGGPETPACP